MVGVFSIFATLPIVDMKEMGIGLAAAVLIDATIVRALLLPASMKLLGEWNWYLPNWLGWLPRLDHGAGPAPLRRRRCARVGDLGARGSAASAADSSSASRGRREPAPASSDASVSGSACRVASKGAECLVSIARDADPPPHASLRRSTSKPAPGSCRSPAGRCRCSTRA